MMDNRVGLRFPIISLPHTLRHIFPWRHPKLRFEQLIEITFVLHTNTLHAY